MKKTKNNKYLPFLAGSILFLAFFLRVYRINDLLGFYYDQGRDALVIWDLLYKGKFFLIGPVTGLEGIFLGPFYYYLIAPFYWLGRGSPIYPSIFLSFITVIALIPLFLLMRKAVGEKGALLFVFVGGLSNFLAMSSRWLSNPTPIFLSGALLLFSLWKIIETKKQIWWIAVALSVGLSLHFESASAFFYIPAVIIFAIWQRRKLPNLGMLFLSFSAFFLTLLPQIVFNQRHEGILWENFSHTFFAQKGFAFPHLIFVTDRLKFFAGVFGKIIFPDLPLAAAFFWLMAVIGLVIGFKKKEVKNYVILSLIFLITVFVGYTLFQGNYKTLYGYYLTGYFLIIVSLFCVGISILWNKRFGKLVMYAFLLIFLWTNSKALVGYFTTEPDYIIYKDQLAALDWIFEDSDSVEGFNVDVYVPPVIPYAYDYLFLWRGTRECGENLCGLELVGQKEFLYTLYEVDPPHPERLEAWLARQEGIGEVEKEAEFGGITVQRRHRIK